MISPYAGSYGTIYPAYGGGHGSYYGYGRQCDRGIPLNYHSHGNLLLTAIGGLLTGDYNGYHPNPVYPSFPIGGYGLGYGGYGLGYGMGGFGGYGMGLGGFGYGFGNVPYGGFFWGSTPSLSACTGEFNNYRSGQAVEKAVLKAEKPSLSYTSRVLNRYYSNPVVRL
jgi:hypothetical protein